MIYDLIIIGGGPAGYHAALTAAGKGMSVALFEEKQVGGTCLNEGCIPSKALLHTAKVYEYAKNASRYGVVIHEAGIDHAAAVQRKDRIVKALVSAVSDRLKKSGVAIINGKAKVQGQEDGVFAVAAQNEASRGRKLLLCTGSESAFPPIPGMQEALRRGFAVSSAQMLSLKEVPARLLVIGGGIIGLEMAQYYAAAGSRVKVFEMLGHIGGNMDRELSSILKRELEQKGIEFALEVRVEEVKENGLVINTARESIFEEGDMVLVSTGRKPRIKDMGFESLGLDLSAGYISTDDRMETVVSGVYAAGDINGKSMLAHTAYREADVAIASMVGEADLMSYDAIPSVLYTSPEAAWIGSSEEELANKGIAFESVKMPMMISGRYAAEGGSPRGVLKIFTEKGTGKLLGAHALGNGASEFIFGAAMIMQAGISKDKAAKTVFPHPTVGEVLKECLSHNE